MAFSGDHAMIEVIGPPFNVAGTSTSTCTGDSKASIGKQVTVGASIADPALFAAAGTVDSACHVVVTRAEDGRGYTGSAVCPRPTSEGGQEMRKLNYRIELKRIAPNN